MKYRVIATDLDSTFMHHGMTISALNKQMVRQAVASGVHFVVASGRQAPAIAKVQAKVGVSGAKVCLNGAYVVAESGKVLVAEAVAPALIERLFALATSAKVNMMLYRASGVFRYEVTHGLAWRAAFLWHGRGRNRLFATANTMRRLLRQDAVYKVGFNHPDHAVLAGLREQLEAVAGVSMVWASPNFLEIANAGVDKRSGLAALVADWGLTLADIVAFGDYENDLAMLSGVGYGVAMANGLPAVKKAAATVAPNSDHAGVGHTLQKLMAD
ncbi:HAD family hydrolase [Lacticaseibacillus sp. GG6-2]